MAAPKTKTEAQRIERRARVAELYLKGHSMAEVGKIIGVSHDTIFLDLRWCREQWRTRAADAFEKHVQREINKIDLTEIEAARGWERSIGKITKTKEEVGKDGSVNKIIKITEYRAGDPRFLDQILKCVERRCKLLGLDAPTRTTVEDGADDMCRLVDEARKRVLAGKKKKETIQ